MLLLLDMNCSRTSNQKILFTVATVSLQEKSNSKEKNEKKTTMIGIWGYL